MGQIDSETTMVTRFASRNQEMHQETICRSTHAGRVFVEKTSKKRRLRRILWNERMLQTCQIEKKTNSNDLS